MNHVAFGADAGIGQLVILAGISALFGLFLIVFYTVRFIRWLSKKK